jgi:hypothetical protein
MITEGVTYQWYRSGDNHGGDNAIAGATTSSYTLVEADKYSTLYVIAKAGGKEAKSEETGLVTEADYGFMIVNKNVYHTAPVVGDTLFAAAMDNADGSEYTILDAKNYEDLPDSFQWYADGEAIHGATHHRYHVVDEDLGKTLYVEMVWNNPDGTIVERYAVTEPTEAVVEGILPTEGTIVGMTTPAVEEGDNAYAVVGDTLEVQFTKPDNAADPDAKYEWKRNNAPISGATTATYTVKEADEDAYISVEVTTSDNRTNGKGLTIDPSSVAVVKDISGAVVTVKKTKAEKTVTQEESPAGRNDTFTVTSVKLGKDELLDNVPSACDLNWYRDEVKAENLLCNRAGNPIEDDSIVYPFAFNEDGDRVSLIGHKLIAVAVGDPEGFYTGQASSAQTEMMTQVVAPVAVTAIGKDVRSDGVAEGVRGDFIPERTILSAWVYRPNAEIGYQWYKQINGEEDYVAIEGATDATYIPPAGDAGTKDNDYEDFVVSYKVKVVNNGGYRAIDAPYDEAVYSGNIKWHSAESGTAVARVNAIGVDNETPQAGDTLTASSNLKTADDANALTYTWHLMKPKVEEPKDRDDFEEVETKDGKTYPVPTTAKKGYMVVTTVTSNSDKFVVRDNMMPAFATVQGTYEVSLESNATEKDASDTVIYDGVANPKLGYDPEKGQVDTLHAVVKDGTTVLNKYDPETENENYVKGIKYTWYADDEVVQSGYGLYYSSLELDEIEFYDKTITVKAEDGTDYVGATGTSSPTGKVGARVQLTVKKNGEPIVNPAAEVIDNNDTLVAKVGVLLTPDAEELVALGDEEGVTYTWEITAGDGQQYTVTGDTLKMKERYLGGAVTITATSEGLDPGEEGSLTQTFDLAVQDSMKRPN